MVTDAHLLRCETILGLMSQAGIKTAAVTAKDKLRKMLGYHLDGISFSSQCADECTVEENGIADAETLVGRPKPGMYSPDLSLFVLDAGIRLIERGEARNCFTCLCRTGSSTAHAPASRRQTNFIGEIDRRVARMIELGAVVGITADHGMNDKAAADGSPNVIFLEDELNARFGEARFRVICSDEAGTGQPVVKRALASFLYRAGPRKICAPRRPGNRSSFRVELRHPRFEPQRATSPMAALAPVLTPHGVLSLKPSDDAIALDPVRTARMEKAFARGPGHGLLCLGADEVGTSLPPVLSYWREFGTRYVTALCALPGLGEGATKPRRPCSRRRRTDQAGRRRSAHDRRGIPDGRRARRSLARHGCGVRRRTGRSQGSRSRTSSSPVIPPGTWSGACISISPRTGRTKRPRSPSWRPTRRDLSAQAKAQHLPLGKALQEYAGAKNRERLLSLLMPVQRAAEQCAWLKTHGRRRRDLSSAALEPAAGAAIPEGRCRRWKAPASSCGCRRAGA